MRPSRSPGFLALLALSAATLLPACKPAESGNQQAAAAPAASSAIPAPAPAGQARRIEIGVDNKGYHPASAPARGGEKLVLLFTRTEEQDQLLAAASRRRGRVIALVVHADLDAPGLPGRRRRGDGRRRRGRRRGRLLIATLRRLARRQQGGG